MLHHVELWVRDFESAQSSLGWLLERIGYSTRDTWPNGVSYEHGEHYIVIEQGSDVLDAPHDRLRAGLNHLAFTLPTAEHVETVMEEALQRGFTLMFENRHPHAGGPLHYAAYLENADGFEVELVARFQVVA